MTTTVKVMLPGETPWADVLAESEDGTKQVRIVNVLVAGRNEAARRAYSDHHGVAFRKRHGYASGDVIKVLPRTICGAPWLVSQEVAAECDEDGL